MQCLKHPPWTSRASEDVAEAGVCWHKLSSCMHLGLTVTPLSLETGLYNPDTDLDLNKVMDVS